MAIGLVRVDGAAPIARQPADRGDGAAAPIIPVSMSGQIDHTVEVILRRERSGRPLCAKSGHSKMARQASWSTPSTRCSLHAGRKALPAAPIANFGRPSAPGRIPIDRRLLQPPRHHSALGVVTALSQPFDQLPGVFSQRLARFIAQIMHMAATIDFQLQPS